MVQRAQLTQAHGFENLPNVEDQRVETFDEFSKQNYRQFKWGTPPG